MNDEILILVASAASIGFLHTLFGPDHYLPFIVMSKTGKWTFKKTAIVTFLCGIGHVIGSIVLGLVGITLGVAVSKLEILESFRGEFAAWFLIAFGLLIAAVMLDVLNLGSASEYVQWQILLLFIGLVSLFSGKVGEAFILFVIGAYFLLPTLDIFVPELVDKFYWPGAIILIGLGFIISGIVRSACSSVNNKKNI